MTKKELINQIATETGEPRITVGKIVDALVASVVQAVADSENAVVIAGLGTFRSEVREARKGRNPSTGEEMDIPSKRVPKFKPATEFKNRVDK